MFIIYHIADDVETETRLGITDPITAINTLDAESIARRQAATDLFIGGGYTKMATVAADDIELAYALTQNMETAWSMSTDDKITLVEPVVTIDGKKYAHRSTAVGDIIEHNAEFFVVDEVGFTKLVL